MKKMIALSAILATSTALSALAQDAATTTPPPAAGTTTDTAPDTMPDTGTTMDPGTTGRTVPPTATDTAPMGSDTTTTAEMQVPEGFTLYTCTPMTAEDLRDAEVYSMNDESVSSISDLVLADDGKIDQVVFDVGGFLGIGARNVAVPFEDLRIYTDADNSDVRIHVPMTRDELEALPEYTAVE